MKSTGSIIDRRSSYHTNGLSSISAKQVYSLLEKAHTKAIRELIELHLRNVEMVEKIDQILSMVPYDEILDESFKVLKKEGLLDGKNSDIEYIIFEQVDYFKKHYQKQVESACWEVIFRNIRKTMSANILERYYKKLVEHKAEQMATSSDAQTQMVAEMTNDLDSFDLGGGD